MKAKNIITTIALFIFMSLFVLSNGSAQSTDEQAKDTDEFGVPADLTPEDEEPDTDETDDPEPGDDVSGDDDMTAMDAEEPSYKNPAQAKHASNLQNELFDSDLAEAEDEVADLEKALEEALAAYDEQSDNFDIVKLEADYLAALKAYQEADKRYADLLGEKTGLGLQIKEMRQNKMGWGQIYRELGVAQGVKGVRGLKLGHVKNDKIKNGPNQIVDIAPEPLDIDKEILEATQRNTKNGWFKKNQVNKIKKSGSQKEIGLTGTSQAAESVVSDTIGGKAKGSKGKAASAGGTGKSDKSGKSKNNNGKSGEKSNKSSNGKSGKENQGNGKK